MARTETILSIFLASPGDVVEERNRLEDAVIEWNRTWARDFGVRLELLRWENDAFPDVGVDAQEVINRQIPQDYDLFIGIMWSRFGTPTVRAGSGTEEEFQLAITRAGSQANVAILFYFKDAPISPSKVEPAQLAKVQEFRSSLNQAGVLYWDFVDSDQFEKLVTLHISKHVQSRRTVKSLLHTTVNPTPPTQVVAPPTQPVFTEESSDEDEGYLDLLEIFSERNAEITEIANRLSDAQDELAAKTAQGTSEILALHNAPHVATPAQAKRLIAKVADAMLQYNTRVDAEVVLLRAATNASMNALTRVATLSVDFDAEQLLPQKTAASGLLTALSGARKATAEFRATTAALPRLTKELNIAKRQQVAALDALIAEFENAERLLAEALTVIDSLILTHAII